MSKTKQAEHAGAHFRLDFALRGIAHTPMRLPPRRWSNWCSGPACVWAHQSYWYIENVERVDDAG